MSASEAFPGALDWERFDDACKRAEEDRDRAIKAAEAERNRVLNALYRWRAPGRVRAAAETRYQAKVKRARDICDKACEAAEAELTTALDHREGKTG